MSHFTKKRKNIDWQNGKSICTLIVNKLYFILFSFYMCIHNIHAHTYTHDSWKVHRLTKIFLWIVTKWGLFTSSIGIGGVCMAWWLKWWTVALKYVSSNSSYYIHFQTRTLGKGVNPLIQPPSYELHSITAVLQEWLWH